MGYNQAQAQGYGCVSTQAKPVEIKAIFVREIHFISTDSRNPVGLRLIRDKDKDPAASRLRLQHLPSPRYPLTIQVFRLLVGWATIRLRVRDMEEV
jgi:hypothetical protein